jgi:hypothetical protein
MQLSSPSSLNQPLAMLRHNAHAPLLALKVQIAKVNWLRPD